MIGKTEKNGERILSRILNIKRILLAVILSLIFFFLVFIRYKASSNFFVYPNLFCDENIYFLEALRMTRDKDVIPQSFHGGSANYLLPSMLVALDIQVTDQELFFLGRAIYSVVLPVVSALFLAGAVFNLTRKIWLVVVTLVSFVLSPVILATGLYWYPDSWIYFWTSLVILLLTFQWKSQRNSFVLRGLVIFVLALGLSTKLTFLFVVLWVFIVRVIQLTQIEKQKAKNVMIEVSKDAITLLLFFLILNPGYIARYLSAIRWSASNFFVYQVDTANSGSNATYLNGLEFHITLLALSIPMLLLPALYYVVSLKRQFLVVSTIFPIILLIAIFSAQSQYLARNLLVIIPFAILLGTLGLDALQHGNKLRNKSAYLLVGVMVALQGFAVASFTLTNYKADPRTFLMQSTREFSPRTIGVSDACTNSGLPTFVDTVVDPLMTRQLSDYVLLSSGISILRGFDDPVSWDKPVYWGLEFGRDPNQLILGDFLNVYNSPTLPKGYDYQVIEGNHFSVIVLSR